MLFSMSMWLKVHPVVPEIITHRPFLVGSLHNEPIFAMESMVVELAVFSLTNPVAEMSGYGPSKICEQLDAQSP